MTDPGDLALGRAEGQQFGLADYQRDFRQRDEQIIGRDGWKFERRQDFQEQDSPSWEAWCRGDLREALRHLDAKRELWAGIAREDRERGSVFRRVRIVAEPLTPYVQWELHAFRVQAESGMPIRVVGKEMLEPWESAGALPEVVTLGGQVLYEVRYTEAGVLDGAVRFTDPLLLLNLNV